MAELVKWLTRQIVALVCVGSIPTFRPIKNNTALKPIKIKGLRAFLCFYNLKKGQN